MGRPSDNPIRTIADLPETGLVLWKDFLSVGDDRRLMPCTDTTWRRMISKGEAPEGVPIFGRIATHAEHLRAIASGKDWRKVRTAADVEAA